jgi:Ca2+/H+ antiporter
VRFVSDLRPRRPRASVYFLSCARPGLLFFVAVCLSIVSLMKMGNAFNAGGLASELALSRFISVLMLAAYGLYLYFQLKTHAHMFNDDDDEEGGAEGGAEGASSADEAGAAHDSEPVALPSSDPADDVDGDSSYMVRCVLVMWGLCGVCFFELLIFYCSHLFIRRPISLIVCVFTSSRS